MTWKFTWPPSSAYRHIVGASDRAWRPTDLRWSADVSPLVTASRIFEATWVRVPVSVRETFSQTSSSTARKSAVVAGSNMGDPHRKLAHDVKIKRP